MGKIKNIVFDFGGVLVDWNPRYVFRTYFNDENEMEYFLSNVCNGEWNAEQDRGRTFDEGVRLLKEQYPQYSEAIQMFKDRWEFMIKGEFPETVELLKELKEKGYGIYGLTNWSAETIGKAYERFKFFALFDGIVVSGEERLLKPDKRIFKVLLDRYGLNPEECVFMDDSEANVKSAAELGFNAIQFDCIQNVREKLSRLLGA